MGREQINSPGSIQLSRREALILGVNAVAVAACATVKSPTPEPSLRINPLANLTPEPDRTATPTPGRTRKPTPEPTPEHESNIYYPGDVLYNGPTNTNTVFITFDDCWYPDLMDELMSYGQPLTFFPVGDAIRFHPDTFKKAIELGFPLENHTEDHADLAPLKLARVKKELAQQQTEIARILEQDESEQQFFIRPPYGDGIFINPPDPEIVDAAKNLGLVVAGWSVDSLSTQMDQKQTIEKGKKKVLANIGDPVPGDIIVMHVNNFDVAAFPDLVEKIMSSGLKLETLRNGIPLAGKQGLAPSPEPILAPTPEPMESPFPSPSV